MRTSNRHLGIAAAALAPGDRLPGIQTDFDQINGVPASLVGELSPPIHLLEELGLRTETSIVNFDMQGARDLAWHTAQRAVELLDFEVVAFVQLLIHPPAPIALKLAPLRIRESNDVRHVIDVRPSSYEFRGAGRGVRRGPGDRPTNS